MTTSIEKEGYCHNELCEYKINGSCADGIPLDECSNLKFADDAEIDESNLADIDEELDDEDHEVQEPAFLTLHHGQVLLWEETLTMFPEKPYHVVIVAGASESGKTTLIAALNDCFQHGSVGQWSFAGSRTLVGFEWRCHTARIASGANRAHTNRTNRGAPQLLHLRIRTDARSPNEDLLLCDLSGENYQLICSSDQAALDFAPMSRADHITILVDGKQILNHLRQSALNSVRDLLVTLSEAKRILEHTTISIVVTKWDWLVNADSKNPSETLAETQFEGIQTFLKHTLKRLNLESRTVYLRIASRSDHSDIKPGTGLDELLETWMKSRHWMDTPPAHPHIAQGRGEGWTAFKAEREVEKRDDL